MLTILIFLLSSMSATAQEAKATPPVPPKLPRYEIGIASGSFYVPDYPGADESRRRTLVLPYVIYRGDIIRSEREGGIRGRFLKRENLEFDLSFNAAFNSRSEDNDARQGMPDLDWLGEVGPRLLYHFSRNPKHKLSFSFPVRFVFSADVENWKFYGNELGMTVNPEISLSHSGIFGRTTSVRAAVGATWAQEKLMDYFYQVDVPYATANRPAYDASGGYMATDFSLALIKFIPARRMAFFAGVTWNVFNDAENRASPLLRDRTTESYAAGLVWSIVQSKETATHND